ncbi:MAG: hypothetical protein FJ039_11425 [Chloroflexi bacterium]|nr:hypothetical protein [Chloroflexota bacterium]
MTTKQGLTIAVPVVLVVAVVAQALPSSEGATYSKVLEPGALLANALLALWVSLMYRGALRSAFLFLSGFFLLYGLVNIDSLVEQAAEALDGSFLRALLAYQIVTYALLLIACAYILKVVSVKRLTRRGRLITRGGGLLALGIVLFFLPVFSDFLGFDALPNEFAVLNLLVRIFDVTVMVLLIPVVWLYIQNARAKYQESATFTVVAVGIIASLVLVYVAELLTWEPIAEIADGSFVVNRENHAGTYLDTLYIFGYLLIGVGLFLHRKHQEWSFKKVESLLK